MRDVETGFLRRLVGDFQFGLSWDFSQEIVKLEIEYDPWPRSEGTLGELPDTGLRFPGTGFPDQRHSLPVCRVAKVHRLPGKFELPGIVTYG